jgi:transcriptional regulator with XRE-family HTH domain
MSKDAGDPVEVRQSFAEELRAICARKNLADRQVGEKIGIDQSQVSRLKNGKFHRVPERETLLTWFEKMGLSWDEQFPLFWAARMLPSLPEGFSSDDAFLLRRALRELVTPGSQVRYAPLLRERMFELWSKA